MMFAMVAAMMSEMMFCSHPHGLIISEIRTNYVAINLILTWALL